MISSHDPIVISGAEELPLYRSFSHDPRIVRSALKKGNFFAFLTDALGDVNAERPSRRICPLNED